jgi:hypothetical protein
VIVELPWFKIYAAECLSDESFQSWDITERGAWFTLLLVNWREGSIPNDRTSLARLLHVDSSTMAQLWSAIGSKFVESPDVQGRLTSPRLELEREKAKILTRKRSEAGREGANLRWSKENRVNGKTIALLSVANANPMAADGDPDVDGDAGKTSQPEGVSPRVEAFRRRLAGRLEIENFGVGRNASEVDAFFRSQLDAVGEDSLLVECCDLAPKMRTSPGNLSAFVGWLKKYPLPKEVRS